MKKVKPSNNFYLKKKPIKKNKFSRNNSNNWCSSFSRINQSHFSWVFYQSGLYLITNDNFLAVFLHIFLVLWWSRTNLSISGFFIIAPILVFSNIFSCLYYIVACNFTKKDITPSVFFTFLKLYKWYQIVQNISYTLNTNVLLKKTWRWINNN